MALSCWLDMQNTNDACELIGFAGKLIIKKIIIFKNQEHRNRYAAL